MNNRAELTIRGLIIGIIITLVFTAANVVFRAQGRAHIFDIDSGGGDFDGSSSRIQGCHRSGKQHRPDGRVGGGDAFVDHFRSAGFDHDRLLDRVSFLDFVLDLRARRNPRRDVFDPAPARVGHDLGFAVSRRRRVRGSLEGRQWR